MVVYLEIDRSVETQFSLPFSPMTKTTFTSHGLILVTQPQAKKSFTPASTRPT